MLAFIPGLGQIVAAISAVAGITRVAVGNDNYETGKHKITYGWSALNGFIPINPLLLPIQLAMFVPMVLMFIFLFDIGVWRSFFLAYVAQGLMTAAFAQFFLDWALSIGLGI